MSQKKKKKLVFASMLSLIIFMSGMYIFQLIKLNEANYLLGQKENKLTLLQEETNNLKLAVSKSSNLNRVEDAVKELGYAKIGNIEFINIPSSSVAIK
jgi:hypothetical protein